MNRGKIISSALKTNADNPQYYSSEGFHTIYYLLREYQVGGISKEKLEWLSARLSSGRYNFMISDEELAKIEESIIALHKKYMEIAPNRVKKIISGISQVVNQTIWVSSESALSLINGNVGYLGRVPELQANMWEVIGGEFYFMDEGFLPKIESERVELGIEKLQGNIKSKITGVQTRRKLVSSKSID